jgi:hypothetical protein
LFITPALHLEKGWLPNSIEQSVFSTHRWTTDMDYLQ